MEKKRVKFQFSGWMCILSQQKRLGEDFYIKIFNCQRKESNSNYQVRCAYQTTTNIALLWEMVRILFLFPTRKKLSGIALSWFPSSRSSFLSKFLLTCSVSGVAWRYANLVRNAMLVVLLHIPNCSVSGVAWRYASLVKRCHVSGFAPYPPPALSVVSCEKKHVSQQKCHVSGFAPYPPPALWVVSREDMQI